MVQCMRRETRARIVDSDLKLRNLCDRVVCLPSNPNVDFDFARWASDSRALRTIRCANELDRSHCILRMLQSCSSRGTFLQERFLGIYVLQWSDRQGACLFQNREGFSVFHVNADPGLEPRQRGVSYMYTFVRFQSRAQPGRCTQLFECSPFCPPLGNENKVRNDSRSHDERRGEGTELGNSTSSGVLPFYRIFALRSTEDGPTRCTPNSHRPATTSVARHRLARPPTLQLSRKLFISLRRAPVPQSRRL